MSRPVKCRRIEFFPEDTCLVPAGKQKCEAELIILKVEELEAIRLKELKEYNQEQCAQSMNISRQTFQNIIDSARKKVAIALTEGKGIAVSGGHYKINSCKLKCLDCRHEYAIKYVQDRNICPECGSENIICSSNVEHCRKWCSKSEHFV